MKKIPWFLIANGILLVAVFGIIIQKGDVLSTDNFITMGLIIAILVLYFSVASDFQAYLFTDFRKKIGNVKFFALLVVELALFIFIVYRLSP